MLFHNLVPYQFRSGFDNLYYVLFIEFPAVILLQLQVDPRDSCDLAFFKQFNEAGPDFAFPTQTLCNLQG